ncbi:26S proteasome non-ATPase regulatory subunit 5 [Anopheles bellator]|uniref:26S proteasome non-ATPase regulatory subunit 5 n=1 Tax=Anopheles bellator TaxID=139047 RepID=UPI0026483285|nr:26S proteasome non-ATPase regulatory subunit 5 [Anopheles bellator]
MLIMDVSQLERLMRCLVIKEMRTNSLDLLESKLDDVDQEMYEVMLRTDSLFQFLSDASSDQFITASRIIYDKGLEFYPRGSIVIAQFIERCLTHPKNKVKQFGLRGAAVLANASLPVTQNNVQLLIVHCLPMKEVIVDTLMKILIQTLPPVFTEAGVQSNLHAALECDETIRCRVYEIVCTILEQYPGLLGAADRILQRAFDDLAKDDVLLQTNVLQITTRLLTTKEGFAYVEAADLFRKVYTSFVSIAVNPYVRFVLPNALKFYANAASVQPTIFLARYPEAIDFIFDKAFTGDPMLMVIAYESLGIVGFKNEGKIFLSEKRKDKMDKILKEMQNMMQSATEAFKVRFIESLINLMAAEDEPIDNRISSIAQKWYETMTGREDLEMVQTLFKVPFPDIKMAALKLLSAIVDYRWGQMFFQNTACFGEMLLNRVLDVDVAVTQYKYDVIKKLSASPVMDGFVCETLQQYVSEGAFYRKANVEVVIEGGQ